MARMRKTPSTPPTADSLAEYRTKRDFERTPEPAGSAKAAPSAQRGRELYFCVHKHLASTLHYDFRLEAGGVLLSWAVPKGPSLNPKDKRLAMHVEDHPLDYGDFEGVIPEGYGMGIVMLWDRGTWRPDEKTPDVAQAIEKGELKFHLDGAKLKGQWALVRTRGSMYGAGAKDSWLLIKKRDEWAGEVDITQFAPLSIKSQRDFPEILAEESPDIWQSHEPTKGGAIGKLLKQVIQQAAQQKTGQKR